MISRLEALLRRLCPHAEWGVVRRLWDRGLRRKLANYLWIEFLLARGSTRLWGGKPYWLTVDPANFCQLQCPFCPTGANRGVRDKASMSLEHFERLMDQVGPRVIHLDLMNWGESLLNRRLPEMITAAKRHRIEVKLDANFNDVTEETIERLVRSGLDILSLSIDGISEDTYGRYRVGGRLDKVLANLRALVRKRAELGSSRPRIVWQFLVFRHNEHEVDQVEPFARSLGVDQVSLVAPYLPNEPGYLWEWMPRDPRFQLYPLPGSEPAADERRRAGTSAHVKKTASSSAFHARRFRLSQLLAPRYLSGLWDQAGGARGLALILGRARQAAAADRRGRDGSQEAPSKEGTPPRLCKWPWAGMAVNPDGSVAPCCSVEDQKDDFGNVFRGGWSRLWEGAKYRASRRHVARFASGRAGVIPDDDHVCRRCTAIGTANFQFPLGWKTARPSQGGNRPS